MQNSCRWIATPIGLYFNISDKTCRHPEYNETLSKAFGKCRNPGEDMVNKIQILLLKETPLLSAPDPCKRGGLDPLQSAQVVLESSSA